MKKYEVYQCLHGEPMTDRDKLEVGSPFWNEGKWDNFIVPLLPENCSQLTFIDMGCNAGLFLKLAEERGFEQIIGVDSNPTAVERGLAWRDKNGSKYKIIEAKIENCIDDLPLADYTVLANSHYYFTINDWIDYLDRLQYKTQYCIIVTAEKRRINLCWASAAVSDIRRYFNCWEEVGFIDELPLVGNNPRRLWALCFKSPHLEKVKIEDLHSNNKWQNNFYEEIDKGIDYRNTEYYKIVKDYRKKWSEVYLDMWFQERIKVYLDIKESGMKMPIIVNQDNIILDGNHRYGMVKSLGYRNTFIRRV